MGVAAWVLSLAHVGLCVDFLQEVEQYLLPGTVALVAEIEESWVLPLESRMMALGGVVLRQPRLSILHVLIQHYLPVLEAEIGNLEEERDLAMDEAKALLQAKIRQTEVMFQDALSAAKTLIDADKHEAEAKIRVLRARKAKRNGDRKVRIEQHIAAIRAEYVERAAELRTGWQIPSDALSI